MKHILCVGICLLLLCGLLLPIQVAALEPLEPERECSLSVYYGTGGVTFSELEINIYRVAEAHSDGTYDLIAPFDAYPVNIHGITSSAQWRDVATTLAAYVVADQVMPSAVTTTDEQGTAVFTGLETGLYLVSAVVAAHDTGMYYFEEFMIYLPTPLEEGFLYDLQANPKCVLFTPGLSYSVTKLWVDSGNEADRPKEVTVEIYRDGQLVETVKLSAENNWTYSWSVPDGQGIWTVREVGVADPYSVVLKRNETAFVLTNTHDDDSTPDPTGDVFPLWLVVLGLCFGGCGLLLLGIRYERKRG